MRLPLDGVSVVIDGRALVHALDLTVSDGTVVGLIGPNGSGKSTALRCVYRALRPSAGAVLIDGTDVATLSLRDSARSIAALTQENHTELDFTVREVVAMGRAPHLRDSQALGAHEHALCQQAMAQRDVPGLADRGLLTLPGSDAQR